MACDECDGWEWEVDNSRQQREEPFRIGEGIRVRLVKFQALHRMTMSFAILTHIALQVGLTVHQNLASFPLVITAPSLSDPSIFRTVL